MLPAPRGCSSVPCETWPIEPPPEEKAAQLMPAWYEVGQRDLDDLRLEHHLALDESRVARR